MNRTEHSGSHDDDGRHEDHAGNGDTMPVATIERALRIHRSIAACHAHIARGDDNLHARTAGLVLPCYRAEFLACVQRLTFAQQRELRTALQTLHETA